MKSLFSLKWAGGGVGGGGCQSQQNFPLYFPCLCTALCWCCCVHSWTAWKSIPYLLPLLLYHQKPWSLASAHSSLMNLPSQRSRDQSLIKPVIAFTVFFLRLFSFAFLDIMLSWACLTGSPSLSCRSSQGSWPSLPPGPEGLSLSVANYPVSGYRHHQSRHDFQPSLQQPQSLSWSQSNRGPERWGDLLES